MTSLKRPASVAIGNAADDDDDDDDDDATVLIDDDDDHDDEDRQRLMQFMPWSEVLLKLPLRAAFALSATCRYMLMRVRRDLHVVELCEESTRPLVRNPHAALRFLAHCSDLHSLRITVNQLFSSVPAAGAALVAVRKLLLRQATLAQLDVKLPLQCMVDFARLKELEIEDWHFRGEVTKALFSMCATSLTHLTIGRTMTNFAFGSMPPMLKLTSLRLHSKTQVQKWAVVWKRLPAISSLTVSQGNVPVAVLPPTLLEFATVHTYQCPLGLVSLTQQMAALQECCARIHTLKFAIAVEDNPTATVRHLFQSLRLANLHNLSLQFYSTMRDIALSEADLASIRAALTQSRARASSLVFVEICITQRFCGSHRHVLLHV